MLPLVVIAVSHWLDPFRGSAARQVLYTILTGLLSGLLIAVAVLAVAAVNAYRNRARPSPQPADRIS
jgi:hypothetical protein